MSSNSALDLSKQHIFILIMDIKQECKRSEFSSCKYSMNLLIPQFLHKRNFNLLENKMILYSDSNE
jgi:hypothetical protein